jgi:hypothetical protein
VKIDARKKDFANRDESAAKNESDNAGSKIESNVYPRCSSIGNVSTVSIQKTVDIFSEGEQVTNTMREAFVTKR